MVLIGQVCFAPSTIVRPSFARARASRSAGGSSSAALALAASTFARVRSSFSSSSGSFRSSPASVPLRPSMAAEALPNVASTLSTALSA
jgi:hypothetical protein